MKLKFVLALAVGLAVATASTAAYAGIGTGHHGTQTKRRHPGHGALPVTPAASATSPTSPTPNVSAPAGSPVTNSATPAPPTRSATTVRPATVALPINGFERPPAGSAYPLTQWAADGWRAPWDEGMATRTSVDGSVARSGSRSLRVLYPAGKIGPADSGAQAPFAVPSGREYYLSQWVRFSSDYSWGTTEFAGKVGLGLAGGAACSGGQVCTGDNGFSSRMIWLSNARAGIYYYHMGHSGQYGDFVVLKDNGADIKYPRGQWINLVQRLKVNTVTAGVANPDGEIEVWFNGKSAALVTGLRFVRNNDLVDKAYFSSFFGGATQTFAPKNDSYIWYDDLKVSTNRSDICELTTPGANC
jgi:hypothetical protein